MIKKLLVSTALGLLTLGALGLLVTARQQHKRDALRSALRRQARHYRDSTFLVNHIDTLRHYAQPLCSHFQGQPLCALGQPLTQLPAAFSYRANLEFEQVGEPFMHEYVSFDSYYAAANGDTGPNGSLWLLTDAQGRLYGVHATWVIAAVLSPQEQLVARQELTRWLPCLQGQLEFEHPKTVVVAGEEFEEVVEMVPATDSTWGRLAYDVQLKPPVKASRQTSR